MFAIGSQRLFLSLSLALSCCALLGCEIEVDDLEVEDAFALEPGPVDVLWLVDNSGSMDEAQLALGAAFPTLLDEISVLGLDWQMGIVTTDMSNPDQRGRLLEISGDGSIVMSPDTPDLANRFALRIRVGTEGSPVERGLEASWAAVSSPLATHDNFGFIREEARLAIVVVSDDEDCSHEGGLSIESSEACAADPSSLVPVSDYVVRWEGFKDDPLALSVHALVETEGVTTEFEGCGGTTPGTRYISAARATGGYVAPLCGDLSLPFAELGRQISGRRSAFPLSRRPDPDSISVRLETTDVLGQPATEVPEDPTKQSGWTWHESSNSVRLWGDHVPDLGVTVMVRYLVGASG